MRGTRAAADEAAASRWPVVPVVPVVPVLSAAQAAAADTATIAAGTPSRALMQRAGAAAAAEIARAYGARLRQGVHICCGPGNNGGDGWVVARALAAAGVGVTVSATGATRTGDARAERTLAEPHVSVLPGADTPDAPTLHAGIVVDALLGTGASGEPRGAVGAVIRAMAERRERGAVVVALDVPSGVNADSGAATLAVRADLTTTFGGMKRGLLVARGHAGRIVVVDIGLSPEGADSAGARLVTARWVHAHVPAIAPDANKGTRRKLVIVGGHSGMAGAAMLAARAAMRSGIGMVRLIVARENLAIVQTALPEALAGVWPGEGAQDMDDAITAWADTVLIGPGLGHGPDSRRLVERVLCDWRGPVVLDADALNAFAGDAGALGALLDGRPALLTPHPVEFARLSGVPVSDVLAQRFEVGAALAGRAHAAVLLKGVPTVITGTDGHSLVSGAGTPALATAGSGDLLGGIAATLLAQTGDAHAAGACAAWVHGRAAELAAYAGPQRGVVRGITLVDIEHAISRVWSEPVQQPAYPVLAELPAITP
ncbi:MAG: NAD(P)H-hydrate dehydratase [Gemmatimonadaceae bacterium]